MLRAVCCVVLAAMLAACATPKGGPSAAGTSLPSGTDFAGLESWNDGPARQEIVAFVARVTDPASPEFVPEAERIATFDNDGTLWSEKPLYFQLLFAIDRVRELAPEHPEWRETQPFKACARERPGSGARGRGLRVSSAAGDGVARWDDDRRVRIDRRGVARHREAPGPRSAIHRARLSADARAARLPCGRTDSRSYIVSGGGIEFMRPWVEGVYGIPPEQVGGIQT